MYLIFSYFIPLIQEKNKFFGNFAYSGHTLKVKIFYSERKRRTN